jgi:hypothetical protein
MANITEEHLHHMARRHHATMKQLDGIKERIGGILGRSIGTIEYGLASWVGGALEGKSDGGTIPIIKLPWNLGIGLAFLTVGHLELAGKHSDHLNNFGNGLVGSFVAAEGYAFGKRWRDTGKLFGGGKGSPFLHPYEEVPAGPVSGDLSQEQMAAIVSRMQQAARAPAHH